MATLITPGGENNWFIGSGALSSPGAAVQSDPNWANVELLLNFDTSVTGDASSTPTTPTSTSGSITRVTSPVRFGTHSANFNAGYINYNSKSLAPGTQNFTIEASVRFPTSAGGPYYLWGGFSLSLMLFPASASTDIRFYVFGTQEYAYTASLAFDTWYHIATSRQGNTFRTFLNGVLIGTTSYTIDASFDVLNIGANQSGQNALVANVDDFRYTRGVARYTSNFTPPSTAFPTQ